MRFALCDLQAGEVTAAVCDHIDGIQAGICMGMAPSLTQSKHKCPRDKDTIGISMFRRNWHEDDHGSPNRFGMQHGG